MKFLVIYLFKMHQILMILHIMTKNNNIYHLRVVEVTEEKLLALKWVQLGLKGAKKRF